jgi:hypothetical protein
VPLTRQFAVSARGFLASEKKEQNPFAAMMGGGAPKSDKITRIWSLGGVFAHRFTSGAKLRLFSAIDSTNLVKTTGLCELGTSAGRLLLSAQVASSRRPRAFPGISYGLTAMLRGVDYTGCLRAATDESTHLPDVGVSYLQRLSPGSPLSLGGEVRAKTRRERAKTKTMDLQLDPRPLLLLRPLWTSFLCRCSSGSPPLPSPLSSPCKRRRQARTSLCSGRSALLTIRSSARCGCTPGLAT